MFASVGIMADLLPKEAEILRRSIAMPPARPERPQPGAGNQVADRLGTLKWSARVSVPGEVPVEGIPSMKK